MEKIQASISKYKTYTGFYHDIEHHKSCMNRLLLRFNMILPYDNTLAKMSQIGHLMSLYYDIYYNDDLHNTFMFSIYLNQYDIDITSISLKCKEGLLRKCKYSKSTKITSMYYLPHIYDNPVKNNISLETNIIITGPNASGKTTLLKSALINVLMSQQFGYGCYKSAKIKIYDMFHSYLNIPDTSGRDSLFQAESRRCKEIIDIIREHKDPAIYRHFCIFDELYSGTNPTEAAKAGCAFLKYLSEHSNVKFILTTHYYSICKRFRKSTKIQNYKMMVDVLPDESFNYTYKLHKGISKIKGGLRVLKDLDYPNEIIQMIENQNKKIHNSITQI
jgi:dsDNA-specific endonuclease/ATPase MutS2